MCVNNPILSVSPGRELIFLSGQGISSFVQGLCTQDVRLLYRSLAWEKLNTKFAVSCKQALFLPNSGKLLIDCLISRSKDQKQYILDVDERVSTRFQSWLHKRVCSQDVIVEKPQKVSVIELFHPQICKYMKDSWGSKKKNEKKIQDTFAWYSRWSASAALEDSTTSSQFVDIISKELNVPINLGPKSEFQPMVTIDPRMPLSVRMWIPGSIGICPGLDTLSRIYKFQRILNGVCEGVNEIPLRQSYPQAYNFDFLNYVNFEKGCFLGQELVSRASFVLSIRRRIALLIAQTDTEPSSSQPSFDTRIFNLLTSKSTFQTDRDGKELKQTDFKLYLYAVPQTVALKPVHVEKENGSVFVCFSLLLSHNLVKCGVVILHEGNCALSSFHTRHLCAEKNLSTLQDFEEVLASLKHSGWEYVCGVETEEILNDKENTQSSAIHNKTLFCVKADIKLKPWQQFKEIA